MVARLIVLIALCAATASAVGLRDIIARISEQGAAVDTDMYFLSTGHNSAWQAPFATGTGNPVTWYNPIGASTNIFAPPIAFFTNAGTYRVACSDWSKITRLSFYAGGDVVTRNYLTNIANSAHAMARLKDVTTMSEMFRQQTNLLANISSWPLGLFTNNTSLSATFNGCSGLTGTIPDISTMTKNTSLSYTFRNCTGLTGTIPDISTMTNNTSLVATFNGCSGLTGTIPDISTMTKNISLYATFFNCTGLTGTIPDISTMTNNISLEYTFWGCTGITGNVATIFSNTNNLTKITTSANAFYNVRKLTGEGMRFVNAPKAATYTVGTNSTNSSYRTFYGCTNLSDYATIPAAYK